jgi:hypothetical protein
MHQPSGNRQIGEPDITDIHEPRTPALLQRPDRPANRFVGPGWPGLTELGSHPEQTIDAQLTQLLDEEANPVGGMRRSNRNGQSRFRSRHLLFVPALYSPRCEGSVPTSPPTVRIGNRSAVGRAEHAAKVVVLEIGQNEDTRFPRGRHVEMRDVAHSAPLRNVNAH